VSVNSIFYLYRVDNGKHRNYACTLTEKSTPYQSGDGGKVTKAAVKAQKTKMRCPKPQLPPWTLPPWTHAVAGVPKPRTLKRRTGRLRTPIWLGIIVLQSLLNGRRRPRTYKRDGRLWNGPLYARHPAPQLDALPRVGELKSRRAV
jgi:hypothetical protein